MKRIVIPAVVLWLIGSMAYAVINLGVTRLDLWPPISMVGFLLAFVVYLLRSPARSYRIHFVIFAIVALMFSCNFLLTIPLLVQDPRWSAVVFLYRQFLSTLICGGLAVGVVLAYQCFARRDSGADIKNQKTHK